LVKRVHLTAFLQVTFVDLVLDKELDARTTILFACFSTPEPPPPNIRASLERAQCNWNISCVGESERTKQRRVLAMEAKSYAMVVTMYVHEERSNHAETCTWCLRFAFNNTLISVRG
jgi:hypothetical protein